MVSMPFEYLSNSPTIITNGLLAAHIAQSINAGKPIFEDEVVVTSDNDDDESIIDDNESIMMI